jgi:hypothetical protein
MSQRICTFDGCVRPQKALGYCNGHYVQQRHGKPLTALRRRAIAGMELRDRLDIYTDKAGECWLWTITRDNNGYGRVTVDGKSIKAHRMAYELAYGPISKGLEIDHKCHTPACVRPEHLRVATTKENQENRAGAQANSKSGVRGVTRSAASRKWQAQVRHNGQLFYLGQFATVEEAEAVVIAKRNELFTHNDADRMELRIEQIA